jgi:hypothetical protein
MNDVFKDILDFNNFSVIKEDFSNIKFDLLKSSLSFMGDAEKFINLCMSEGNLNLKIVSKVGPQSITVLS